jgi:hypothetical protein
LFRQAVFTLFEEGRAQIYKRLVNLGQTVCEQNSSVLLPAKDTPRQLLILCRTSQAHDIYSQQNRDINVEGFMKGYPWPL